MDFTKIRDKALGHYAKVAAEQLTKKFEKENFPPNELKQRVIEGTPALAQVMFDGFVASMDKHAAGLISADLLSVDIAKALFEGVRLKPRLLPHVQMNSAKSTVA